MSPPGTEGFFVLHSEGAGLADKPKVEKTAKGSLGGEARKKLGDISNLPQQLRLSNQYEKGQSVSNSTKEYIDQLQQENMMLMKLLTDRNKIIELSGIELQKLRINLQKFQQQNLQLAQANTQMLAELNSGKDKLKALQHELGCKNSLLKVKKVEQTGKAKNKICQNIENQVEASKSEEQRQCSEADRALNKHSKTNRKQRSKSLGPSTLKEVQLKEKTESKRVCLRRQSARFKHEESEPTEDVVEKDTKFPASSLHEDQMQEEGSTSTASSAKRDGEGSGRGPSDDEAQEFLRPSMGRPSRLAAKKVQSYKEIPLNVKMRRSE
ncbi:SHUGOSHIN 1-like [Diospyros lotus]|uniref:SHUGOSHIN 1-like n=1 Tax=Diospyros lotus TaxID=55363 RepID=UPI002250B96D|nr:SHUGOSHIN 1-like [Diospyros lotus]